jgi:hypothetical protein
MNETVSRIIVDMDWGLIEGAFNAIEHTINTQRYLIPVLVFAVVFRLLAKTILEYIKYFYPKP